MSLHNIMKKMAIVIAAVGALNMAFAAPAFADQPENHGCYGERVSDQTPENIDVSFNDNSN